MIIKKSILYIFIFFNGILFANDHGNSIYTATNIELNSSISGQFETTTDNDYFRFSLTTTQTVTINSTSLLYIYGYILNSSGRRITYNLNRATDRNCRIYKELPAGTYYISIRSGEIGSYGLSIVSSAPIPDDHGDLISTATNLQLNSSTTGRIEIVGDSDYFRFSVATTQLLTINSIGSLDTFGYLINSSGRVIASNENGGLGDNFRISKELSAGTYYIIVRGYTSAMTGFYGLSIVSSTPTPDDHGNLISTATNMEINSSTRGRIETEEDYDYFRVSLTTTGVLTVNSTGHIDTYGSILDSRGNHITSNDDSGNERNFRLSRQLVAGTYYIRVKGVYSYITGSYGLNVIFNSSTLNNSDDHGNSISRATNIDVNSSTRGQIETRGDYDYFRISLATVGTLTVSSTGTLDTYGYILNSSRRVIASNDDGGTGTNFRILRELSAGIYYIKVRAYSSALLGNYNLNIAFQHLTEHGNSIATATRVEANSAIRARIGREGENDYFRVDLNSSGTLTIASTGLLNTYGYLLDSSGNIITVNDNRGGYNFGISRGVVAGTYYIRVRSYTPSRTGSYSLTVSFTNTLTPNNDDHGNSITTATPIILRERGGSIIGNIEDSRDNDYFRFDLNSTKIAYITTGDLSEEIDTYGYLLNSRGEIIEENDDEGAGSEGHFGILRQLSAGTYYIRVRGFGSSMGAYTLRVAFSSN